MHDRASVNGAAMHPYIFHVGCLSHTLNLLGETFKAPNLHLFFVLFGFPYLPIVKWQKLFGKNIQVGQCLSILRLVDGGETSSSSAIWRCSTLFTGEY